MLYSNEKEPKLRMKKKNVRERRHLAEMINEKLDLPPDVLPGSTLIEIRAQSSLSVTGAKKILLYSPTHIRLATKKGALSVMGRRLVCTSYHPEGVKIDGHIVSVSFEEANDESI